VVTSALPSAVRSSRSVILELCRNAHPHQAFLADLSELTRTLVPFTGSFWTAADPLTTLPTSPARVENLASQEACAGYWESEFLIEDFIHFRDLARAQRPVASLYRATGGHPARSARHRAMNQHLGYGDELRVVFRTDHVVWGFASVWRENHEDPFSDEDERIVAELSEPVAQVFRRSVIGAVGIPDMVGSDVPGLLIFDGHGELESANDQARAWLDELPSTASVPGAGLVPALRTELLTVSMRARAIAAGLDGGVAAARIQGRSGRWLVVHGFAMEGGDGDPGRTALVIQPARGSDVATIVVQAYELTAREQQLTQLISYGLATGEIANRLGLSPHTIRDYVKQVFEKVGVTSRGELVAKLFAEHYNPALEAGMVHTRVAVH
jgi:DNA-binding CsgD family transcriptional regulator